VRGRAGTAVAQERDPSGTSPTAPGVTRRWSNMKAYAEEVANARIWAGFHYRFSTRVGTRMGYQVGEYVVRTVMQPIATTSR